MLTAAGCLFLSCENVRSLPICVEGSFGGDHISVTRADVIAFGKPHGGTLKVANFNSKSYFDRLRWKQLAKPTLQLRIPMQVYALTRLSRETTAHIYLIHKATCGK